MPPVLARPCAAFDFKVHVRDDVIRRYVPRTHSKGGASSEFDSALGGDDSVARVTEASKLGMRDDEINATRLAVCVDPAREIHRRQARLICRCNGFTWPHVMPRPFATEHAEAPEPDLGIGDRLLLVVDNSNL